MLYFEILLLLLVLFSSFALNIVIVN